MGDSPSDPAPCPKCQSRDTSRTGTYTLDTRDSPEGNGGEFRVVVNAVTY